MAVILLTYYLYKDLNVCFEIEGRMSGYYEFFFKMQISVYLY